MTRKEYYFGVEISEETKEEADKIFSKLPHEGGPNAMILKKQKIEDHIEMMKHLAKKYGYRVIK